MKHLKISVSQILQVPDSAKLVTSPCGNFTVLKIGDKMYQPSADWLQWEYDAGSTALGNGGFTSLENDLVPPKTELLIENSNLEPAWHPDSIEEGLEISRKSI